MKIGAAVQFKFQFVVGGLLVALILAQGIARYNSEELMNAGNRMIPRSYDPRGHLVEIFRKKSERAYFQVNGNFGEHISWPGLASLEWSLTWLRILASTYDEASVEGDFSWLFHNLRFISQQLPREKSDVENSFHTAMLPLFVVLGKDPAGALYLLNEKLSLYPNDWRLPYWMAMHALENLHDQKMAGFYFLSAAKLPGSPPYFAPLGFRLSYGAEVVNQKLLRHEFLKRTDPVLLEKIKKLRPAWFTN